MEKLLTSFQMPSPNETIALVKGILDKFFNYYSNAVIKEIPYELIIQSKIIDANQMNYDKEKIELLFNYCNQVGKFNQYILNQLTDSIDKIKNVFDNFILISNFEEQLKSQLDNIYSQIAIPKLNSEIIIQELIKQEHVIDLPHQKKTYIEKFNPEYPTITSCFIDGEVYITGGYDGKVVFFDNQSIQYELNIMNNPIVQIKKLNNNTLLIIDESNNYALLGNRQIIEQGQINIDSSIVCIEQLNDFVGIQFENGKYCKFNSKYGFKKYHEFQLYNDSNLKTLARNDDVVIITDHFNSGSIIINRYNQQQLLQSHFVFQIGQNHITKAFIDQDGQNYFINCMNEVYLNDEKLEIQVEHFINKQIQYSEECLIVNNTKLQTSLFKILHVAISNNILMVVGSGQPNNYEIYHIK